jgi:hypothetical protein
MDDRQRHHYGIHVHRSQQLQPRHRGVGRLQR